MAGVNRGFGTGRDYGRQLGGPAGGRGPRAEATAGSGEDVPILARPWRSLAGSVGDRTRFVDAVIEAYKRDVDRTLLRENLKPSPEERGRFLSRAVRSTSPVSAPARRLR